MDHTLNSKVSKNFFGGGVCSGTWITLIQGTELFESQESAEKEVGLQCAKIQPAMVQGNTAILNWKKSSLAMRDRPLNLPLVTGVKNSVIIDLSFSITCM